VSCAETVEPIDL